MLVLQSKLWLMQEVSQRSCSYLKLGLADVHLREQDIG